jgi:hypothetical protein
MEGNVLEDFRTVSGIPRGQLLDMKLPGSGPIRWRLAGLCRFGFMIDHEEVSDSLNTIE